MCHLPLLKQTSILVKAVHRCGINNDLDLYQSTDNDFLQAPQSVLCPTVKNVNIKAAARLAKTSSFLPNYSLLILHHPCTMLTDSTTCTGD